MTRLPSLFLALAALLTGCSDQAVEMVPIGQDMPNIAKLVADDFPVPANAEVSLVSVCEACNPRHATFRVSVAHTGQALEAAWQLALLEAGYEITSTTDTAGFTFNEISFGHGSMDIDPERSDIMIVDRGRSSWATVEYYETWKDPYPLDHDPSVDAARPEALPDDLPLLRGTVITSSDICYPDICAAPFLKINLSSRRDAAELETEYEQALATTGWSSQWRTQPDIDGPRRLHFGSTDRQIDLDASTITVFPTDGTLTLIELNMQLVRGASFEDAKLN